MILFNLTARYSAMNSHCQHQSQFVLGVEKQTPLRLLVFNHCVLVSLCGTQILDSCLTGAVFAV